MISNSAGIKGTRIFYNHENISHIILNLISTSKTKIDVCGDRMIHIFPYLITEEKFLHELYESNIKE